METTVFVAIKDTKVNDRFYSPFKKRKESNESCRFFSLKDCKRKMAGIRPNVLILGLDIDKDVNKCVDFCSELRENFPAVKILIATTPVDYDKFEAQIYEFTSGYISTEAIPNVIVFAVDAIIKGLFYDYENFVAKVKNDEKQPESLNTTYLKMIDKIKTDNSIETIEKLSEFIKTAEKCRMDIINNLIYGEECLLNEKCKEEYLCLLIDDLILKGYSNWKIASMLKIGTDKVRFNRLKLMYNMRGDNSMGYILHDNGQKIKLSNNEHLLLMYIAAGFTTEQIAENFIKSPETIKKQRKYLLEKFLTNKTAIMVMRAMKMGIIKMEEIDDLLQ